MMTKQSLFPKVLFSSDVFVAVAVFDAFKSSLLSLFAGKVRAVTGTPFTLFFMDWF